MIKAAAKHVTTRFIFSYVKQTKSLAKSEQTISPFDLNFTTKYIMALKFGGYIGNRWYYALLLAVF